MKRAPGVKPGVFIFFGTPSPDILTDRERKILIHLAEGRANKEIAYFLGISEGTVKTQVSIILAKLGLSGRTQAAVYANNFGLLPVEQN
jgi:DNA-binding NarL/FixJ family response regulator